MFKPNPKLGKTFTFSHVITTILSTRFFFVCVCGGGGGHIGLSALQLLPCPSRFCVGRVVWVPGISVYMVCRVLCYWCSASVPLSCYSLVAFKPLN